MELMNAEDTNGYVKNKELIYYVLYLCNVDGISCMCVCVF